MDDLDRTADKCLAICAEAFGADLGALNFTAYKKALVGLNNAIDAYAQKGRGRLVEGEEG